MDANNTTSLLGADNATGAAGAVTINLLDAILFSVGIFVASWIVLTIVMYVIAPFFGKFGDQRSRAVYSAVYSLPFAIIFGLGLGGVMSLLYEYNIWISLIIMLVIVFVLVMLQSFLLGMLISKGYIKIQSKNAPKGPTKGKRK